MATTPTWSTAPTDELSCLTVDGQDIHMPLWTARTRRERSTGLLGTDDISGGLWIPRCNWVHCFGMRYTIDVVYVNRSGTVVDVAPLAPGRVGLPRLRATAVVEMAQGQAEHAGIRKGSVLSRRPPTSAAVPVPREGDVDVMTRPY